MSGEREAEGNRPELTAQQVIELLGLVPLPVEGGYVRETYRSAAGTESGDPAGTAIFYMLTEDSFSHLHRLTGDEMYHFYLGDAVELTELLPDGSAKRTVLGSDLLKEECIQHLVPAGNWQGSRLKRGGKWALMGTTMCPGYTQEGYEHGNREYLLGQYPSAADEIRRLT